MLLDGFKVFATFSTHSSLPVSGIKKAKYRQSFEYLEIDPDYALCLGIKEGDIVSRDYNTEGLQCVCVNVTS